MSHRSSAATVCTCTPATGHALKNGRHTLVMKTFWTFNQFGPNLAPGPCPSPCGPVFFLRNEAALAAGGTATDDTL